MLKGLKGHKMSRTDKVRVTTFSGCSTRDMFDYINPTINRKPDQLIVHVGTNSLRDSPNPTEWGKYQPKMIELCDWAFETKVIIVCDSFFRKPISIVYCF